eukprot:GHVP01055120.1.p1 GENE.GHVP01055120.1~~GHVP01055120.1.p1  ORF type:complete len:110 (+),score=5.10 GHVP01055120.1:36-332(+)
MAPCSNLRPTTIFPQKPVENFHKTEIQESPDPFYLNRLEKWVMEKVFETFKTLWTKGRLPRVHIAAIEFLHHTDAKIFYIILAYTSPYSVYFNLDTHT